MMVKSKYGVKGDVVCLLLSSLLLVEPLIVFWNFVMKDQTSTKFKWFKLNQTTYFFRKENSTIARK
jgi:hypothetical protein